MEVMASDASVVFETNKTLPKVPRQCHPVGRIKASIFRVDPDLQPVLQACKDVHRLTAGAFRILLDADGKLGCEVPEQIAYARSLTSLLELLKVRLTAGGRGLGGFSSRDSVDLTQVRKLVLDPIHSMDKRFGAPVSSEWAAFLSLLRLVQAKVEFMLTVDINDGEVDVTDSVARPTTVPNMGGEAIEVTMTEEVFESRKQQIVQV